MKYFRLATFTASAAALAYIAYGSLSNIVAMFGISGGASIIFQKPSFLLWGYYQTLGQLDLDINFWAWNGPIVALVLLVALLVASLPSRS